MKIVDKKSYKKAIAYANKCSKAYYLGNEIIDDDEFDALIEKIKKYEKTHTPLKDSPTQKVGSDLSKGFKKVVHTTPMLSLNKALSLDELKEWLISMKTINPNCEFDVEHKMDGCGLDLNYRNGKLIQSVTRGNGIKGDLITENAKQVGGVSEKLRKKIDIHLRGEVIMPRKVFDKFIKQGEQMKNARNSASGALKRHDPKEVKRMKLQFYGYTIVDGGTKKQDKDIKLLKSLKFQTPYITTTNSIKEVLKICDKMAEDRKKLEYNIDGIVIKVNNKKSWKKLGSSATNPKYAIAYKFPNDVVTPKIKSVTMQVGRTGAITPVANYEPRLLCGTTVENASLHNFDKIKELGIKIGDQVEVIKSGEIIPQVRALYKKGLNRKTIKPPKHCPICGERTKFIGVKLYCTNKNCESRVLGTLTNWCAKNNMNVFGVSGATLGALWEKGYVNDVADLYYLTKKKLLKIEGIKEKSANNILESIEASKSAGLSRVISGLGIDTIGNTIAEELAGKYKTLKKLSKASTSSLSEIETVGEVKAKNIVKWFNHNKKLVKKLMQIDGLVLSEKKAKKVSNKLKGKSFCITGTLSVTRDEFQARIKANGGIAVSSVSKNTDYLICGVNGGSKLSKAEKLGIKIISENQFNKMCK